MDKRSSSETTNLVGANTFCQLHKRIKGFPFTKGTQTSPFYIMPRELQTVVYLYYMMIGNMTATQKMRFNFCSVKSREFEID